MYNVQDYSILNDIHPVTCEGLYFTHMQNTLALPYHFTKGEVWAHKTSFTPTLFIEGSCICALRVLILPLSEIFSIEF